MSLTRIDRRFITWLQGFLVHMGWTHRDLGAAVGRDRVTVSRWLNGHTYPDSLTRMHLNRLAKEEGYEPIPRRWERRNGDTPRA